jgi:hypothetical protein
VSEKRAAAKPFDDFLSFFNEFKNESDRAAVILGAAKIDTILYQILKGFLLPSTEAQDELLDGDTPLSTFHAKISLAYRLGFIDRGFTRALVIVRKIRNSFAHETSGGSLNSSPHRDRIRELKRLFFYEDKFDSAKRMFSIPNEDPSSDFRMSIALLTFRLGGLLDCIKSISNQPWELNPPEFEKIITEAEKLYEDMAKKNVEAGGPKSPGEVTP